MLEGVAGIYQPLPSVSVIKIEWNAVTDERLPLQDHLVKCPTSVYEGKSSGACHGFQMIFSTKDANNSARCNNPPEHG